MKKLLGSFVLVGAALAFSTQAHAVRQTISMTANVGGVCTIGALSGGTNITNASLTATATNGKADAKNANAQMTYNCSSVGVQFVLTSANQGITRALTGGESIPSGQTNKIHYTAQLVLNGGVSAGNIDTTNAATSTKTTTLGSNPSGTVTVDVSILSGQSSSTVLMPGNYSDNLHIDVNPNP